jgi:hypothetical protein
MQETRNFCAPIRRHDLYADYAAVRRPTGASDSFRLALMFADGMSVPVRTAFDELRKAVGFGLRLADRLGKSSSPSPGAQACSVQVLSVQGPELEIRIISGGLLGRSAAHSD